MQGHFKSHRRILNLEIVGEKRCPNCRKWSKWTQSIDDICKHCGHDLSTQEKEKAKRMEEHIQRTEENWMFFIRESDPAWKVNLKKTGNFSYTIFMAIISFILWFIAAFPG